MTEWQPIETAPKDEKVLIWVNHNAVISFLTPNGWHCRATFRPKVDHVKRIVGDELHISYWDKKHGIPTHWMPLPPPPEN